MSQIDPRQLGPEGESEAIERFINRNLQKKNITVKVFVSDDDHLQVFFDGEQVPPKEKAHSFMKKVFERLKPETIKRVSLYGRRVGQQKPEWEQELIIDQVSQSELDSAETIANQIRALSTSNTPKPEDPDTQKEENSVKSDNSAYCPNCGSSHLQIRQDTNVSWGRAAAGWALFGAIGGAVGAVTGEDRNVVACLNCGTTWRAKEIYRIKEIIKERTGKIIDLSKESDRIFINEFINEFGKDIDQIDQSKLSSPQDKAKAYKKIIDSAGHFPKGIYAGNFKIHSIAQHLSKNIGDGELLVDVTGVRYRGTPAYLVLTSERIICWISHNHSKNIEVSLGSIQDIEAGENGFQVKILNDSKSLHQFYYVSPNISDSFKKPLRNIHHNLKTVDKISTSSEEKAVISSDNILAIIGLIFIVFVFGSCIRGMGDGSSSRSASEIEECLRRYVRGETVSESELQEAYEKCR